MHTFQNALKASKRYIHKNIRKNKRETNKGESHNKTLHKIKWPNSLNTVPSGVTNYRNLPFGGRAMRDWWDASSKKGIRAESPPTFI